MQKVTDWWDNFYKTNMKLKQSFTQIKQRMETMEEKPAGMQKKQKVSLWHLRGYVRHGAMSEIAAACSVTVSAVTSVMKGRFRNQCVFDRLTDEIEEGKRQLEENQRKILELGQSMAEA